MTVTPEQIAERMGFSEEKKLRFLMLSNKAQSGFTELEVIEEIGILIKEAFVAYDKSCERIAELENEQYRIKQGLRMRDELVRDGVISPRNK